MTGVTPSKAGFSPASLAARPGGKGTPATPADAFRMAKETYLAGRRLDMRELAVSLGVSRTTLYRWSGDRDRLLTDVIWSITETGIRQLEAATAELRGRARLRLGIELYLQMVAADAALHAFISNETHAALRLMTTDRGGTGHQDRLVGELARIISAENERGDMRLGADPDLVAYTLARVLNAFVYNDSIAAVEPRLDKAMDVVAFILR